jgi:hypothetical protein
MEFKGKDLLILGSSYSAEDIGSQCWKYGAKSITVAYRNAPMGFNWPDNWKEVPALERVDEAPRPISADGTSKKVDAIILCTGYKHHFPFLPDDLRLKTANRLATATTCTRAWSMSTTRSCSMSACRTSGSPSTCSTRRPGGCATRSWARSPCRPTRLSC